MATAKTPAKKTAAAKTTKTPAAKTVKPAAAAKAPAKAAPAKTAPAKKATTKAPAPAAKSRKAAVPPEQRRNYIEVAAYFIAERHGFTPGRELADWAAAEAEIDRLLAEGLLNQ